MRAVLRALLVSALATGAAALALKALDLDATPDGADGPFGADPFGGADDDLPPDLAAFDDGDGDLSEAQASALLRELANYL
jgi:hypothetical protein